MKSTRLWKVELTKNILQNEEHESMRKYCNIESTRAWESAKIIKNEEHEKRRKMNKENFKKGMNRLKTEYTKVYNRMIQLEEENEKMKKLYFECSITPEINEKINEIEKRLKEQDEETTNKNMG